MRNLDNEPNRRGDEAAKRAESDAVKPAEKGTAAPAGKEPKSFMERMLDTVERVGNRVPHPVVIFVLLIAAVILLSHLFYLLGASVTYEGINPDTHQTEQITAKAQSLLTKDGIRFMYSEVVQNFMNFNAVGVIIVAMLGVGVAEAAGLVSALIRKLVLVAPAKALTYILVFVGIVSSIAADAGYLVLIPLAAAAFMSVGRNPLAGLAASFAAVAAVFSVNLFPKPLDGILVGITNDAIHLINPNLSISLLANLWFSIASVLMLTVVVGLITDKLVEPRLGPYRGGVREVKSETMSAEESKGLKYALWATVGLLVFFALLTLPSGAALRNPETGALIGDSPFMNGLIVFIALLFLVAGAAYGIGSGTMKGTVDVIKAMEKAIAGLAGLIFLLFVISQFLAFFTYTKLATLAAVKVGDVLEHLGLGALPLLIGFVIVVGILDLIMTGAIPKWAIFAPVFVPLLMRLHMAPEAVLAGYRVGDSPINAISPLNAYFALIVSFAQRYQKDAGVGTVIALMLPYVIIVFVIWTALLALWQIFGLPWGL
jgi:aminobenzoyl-glutamate transport protein